MIHPVSSTSPLGVGIVGLSGADGWAAIAHLPALAAVEGVELRALTTSNLPSARAAAATHGVPLFFDDVHEMASRDEIDLVVVAVKVPLHRRLVLAALPAGKPVLSEWPLASGLAEADELVTAAAGRRTFVGLQGRSSPSMRYLRDLVADGYVGEVLSTSLVASGRVWGTPVTSRTEYVLDRASGATMLTIPFGHTVDAMAMVLGELTEVSATSATRRTGILNLDTGELVPMTAEDQVAVTGTLEGGAVASLHYRGGSSRGTNFLWEINGTDGDLCVRTDAGSLQLGRITITGGRGDAGTLVELPVPDDYDRFPRFVGRPAHALAHAYAQIVADLVDGTSVVPDFAAACRRHRLLDAVQRAAASGERQQLQTVPFRLPE